MKIQVNIFSVNANETIKQYKTSRPHIAAQVKKITPADVNMPITSM